MGTSEDTFILLDALEQDVDELRDLQPRVCLEIGQVSLHFGFALPNEYSIAAQALDA